MATNPSELEPGNAPDPNEPDPNAPDPNEAPQEDEAGGDPDPAAERIESIAKDLGWVPQDQFKPGEGKEWLPAEQFLRIGRDIQKSYRDDIKGLRSQIDTMSRTTAQILEDRLAEQRRELATQFDAAVEDGDGAKAFKLGQEINRLGTVRPPTEDSATADFKAKHGNWLGQDPVATARAVSICNELAAQGQPTHVQLAAAERTIRAEFPEHFKDNAQINGQRPAQVHNPGARNANPGSNRAKGFSDMPKAAQDMANDMVERGVLTKTEQFVEKYWKNVEGKR